VSETLSERIARQRAERLAAKSVPTTAADWKPLSDAKVRVRIADEKQRRHFDALRALIGD
jgi:hypothetical protein